MIEVKQIQILVERHDDGSAMVRLHRQKDDGHDVIASFRLSEDAARKVATALMPPDAIPAPKPSMSEAELRCKALPRPF